MSWPSNLKLIRVGGDSTQAERRIDSLVLSQTGGTIRDQ
jgi:hypothetical protein